MTLFQSEEGGGPFPDWVRKISAADGAACDRAAADVAQWLADALPESVFQRLPLALANTAAKCDAGVKIPRHADLMVVLQWWNRLAAEGVVSHSVRTEPPSKEIRDAWSKWCANPGWQLEWVDLSSLEEHIRKSSKMVRQGWFRLEKLLRNAENRDGCPVVRKLIDGGYYDETPGQRGTPDGWEVLREFAEKH